MVRAVRAILAGCCALAASLHATGAELPSSPMTVVLSVSPGSAADALMRVVTDKVGPAWKFPMIVKNSPGANGIIATQEVIRSAPDGATLLQLSTSQSINASLYSNLPFDMRNDLKPVVRMVMAPTVLCVNSSLSATNLAQFIALAKSNPGKLNYGSPGTGSTTHLSGEILKEKTGININHVPYKEVSRAQADLIGGHLDFMFIVPAVAIGQVKAGTIRCLAVTSRERIPQMPAVPTLDEAGVPGYEVVAWIGLAGPAGLPDGTADAISEEIVKIISSPDVTKRIVELGMIPAAMSRAAFTRYYDEDLKNWARVIRASGIKPNN